MQKNERSVGRNMRDERTIKLLGVQADAAQIRDRVFTE